MLMLTMSGFADSLVQKQVPSAKRFSGNLALEKPPAKLLGTTVSTPKAHSSRVGLPFSSQPARFFSVYFGQVNHVPDTGKPYGARYNATTGQTHYLLWAPGKQGNPIKQVDLLIFRAPNTSEQEQHVTQTLENRIIETVQALPGDGRGNYTYTTSQNPPGTLYMYRLHYQNGETHVRPDPRSLYQPEDVYGPSQVVDLDAYTWQTPKDWWKNNEFLTDPQQRKMVSYRLHIGTFTPEGTLKSAIQKLHWVKERGYNAIDVMPVMEFPGKRGWSYDQIHHFAIENGYGTWQDFQKLVDEAHKLGLAVLLDVCYNHVGPVGNYHSDFDDQFDNALPRDCGQRFNWQRGGTDLVLQNNKMWIEKARVDGFRFDMTPLYHDDTVLTALNRQLKQLAQAEQRPFYVSIAEDWRGEKENNVGLVSEKGFTQVYDFKYHHLLSEILQGSRGKLHDLKNYLAFGLPHSRQSAYIFSQSHDEISHPQTQKHLAGKRAPRRLESLVPHAFQRALTGSLLKYFIPGKPRNFMGEEYGEKDADFVFFTDKSGCLPYDQANWQVTGRPEKGDPFSPESFEKCKLTWRVNERVRGLTDKAIAFRKFIPALWQGDQNHCHYYSNDTNDGILAFKRWGVEDPDSEVFVVANFSDTPYTTQGAHPKVRFPEGGGGNHSEKQVVWEEVFNSDDRQFDDPTRPPYENGSNRINPTPYSAGHVGINLAPWSIAVFEKKKTGTGSG